MAIVAIWICLLHQHINEGLTSLDSPVPGDGLEVFECGSTGLERSLAWSLLAKAWRLAKLDWAGA